MVAHWVCTECGDEYEGASSSYVCDQCDDNPAPQFCDPDPYPHPKLEEKCCVKT